MPSSSSTPRSRSPREQLIHTVEDGDPVGVSSRRRRRGHPRPDRRRDRQDPGLPGSPRRRRGRGPAHRVHARGGPQAQAGRPARRPRRDRAARRRRLRPDRRPDRQAGRPAAPPRGRARRVFDQFASREGEMITGTVNRVEPRAIILDVGKDVEAILATTEQSAVEHYRIGQNVKAYVLEVRRSTRGPADLRQPDPQGLPEAPVRARGARDPRRHRRDPGDRPRGRQPLEGRGRVAPGRARPGRGDGRPARRPGPGGRGRARRREDRRHPVERRPGRVRRERAQPGPGDLRRHRRGAPDRERHRAGADAVARDRPRGPERPARRATDRLADRHPERRLGRRGQGCARRPRRRPTRPPRSSSRGHQRHGAATAAEAGKAPAKAKAGPSRLPRPSSGEPPTEGCRSARREA